MNIKENVRNFIVETFIFDDSGEQLDNEQSFLETGVIDSTGMLELEEFNIKMDDEELIPSNLDSVNNVVNYINNKKKLTVAG